MSAAAGRDLLLKVEQDGSFTTVAGLRTKALTLNARTVDVTDAGSEGWRDLLANAGLRTAELTGSGIFRSAQSDHIMRQAFFGQEALTCRFLIPSFGQLDGKFLITRLQFLGQYDGAATFELSFASSGPVTFTALP